MNKININKGRNLMKTMAAVVLVGDVYKRQLWECQPQVA